jgi:hypothetical protein
MPYSRSHSPSSCSCSVRVDVSRQSCCSTRRAMRRATLGGRRALHTAHIHQKEDFLSVQYHL